MMRIMRLAQSNWCFWSSDSTHCNCHTSSKSTLSKVQPIWQITNVHIKTSNTVSFVNLRISLVTTRFFHFRFLLITLKIIVKIRAKVSHNNFVYLGREINLAALTAVIGAFGATGDPIRESAARSLVSAAASSSFDCAANHTIQSNCRVMQSKSEEFNYRNMPHAWHTKICFRSS